MAGWVRSGEWYVVRAVVRPTLALVLVAACAQPRSVPGAFERDRLDQRQSEWFAAMAARDADALAALFSEGAVVHVANMPPVEGREAIRGFYERMFGFLAASRATPERTEVSASGDLAYSVGRSVNEFRGPGGAVEYVGKYVLVWERREGEWRVALYSISSNQSDAGG
jgi:uncharacterized protein (TIGR02246 family)